MADDNQGGNWNRASDEQQASDIAASRAERLRSGSSGASQESANISTDPQQQENSLNSQKAEKNNTSATDQAKDMAIDLVKKQAIKSIVAFLIPWLPWIIGAIISLFFIAIASFATYSVYSCAIQKNWTGLIWDQIFKEGFTTLLKESFDGTCGILKNVAPKKTPETPAPPTPSNTGATETDLDGLQPGTGEAAP